MRVEEWLRDESLNESELDRTIAVGLARATRGAPTDVAVRLDDLVIHDNRTWWGGADVRVDTLVVQGSGEGADPTSFYAPQTFAFPQVRDGERLAADRLLVYHGPARHFLDLSIVVSRQRSRDDLGSLLAEEADSDAFRDATGGLLDLAALAVPQLAAVKAAVLAASRLASLALRVLQRRQRDAIGLYRTSWLAAEDFGVGYHPEEGSYRERDLSFRYEIVAV